MKLAYLMLKEEPMSHRLKAVAMSKRDIMLSKLHNLLSGFSRGSKAKLNQFMFKNIRSINVNDNGTSGY